MSEFRISIDVVKGGFVLEYPELKSQDSIESVLYTREVFASPRKLNQKIKEVIDSIGLVTGKD